MELNKMVSLVDTKLKKLTLARNGTETQDRVPALTPLYLCLLKIQCTKSTADTHFYGWLEAGGTHLIASAASNFHSHF